MNVELVSRCLRIMAKTHLRTGQDKRMFRSRHVILCVLAATYKCLGQHAYVLAKTDEAKPDFGYQNPQKD